MAFILSGTVVLSPPVGSSASCWGATYSLCVAQFESHGFEILFFMKAPHRLGYSKLKKIGVRVPVYSTPSNAVCTFDFATEQFSELSL